MVLVETFGVANYEVSGEREEEAAMLLEESLSAVNKRRNGYIEGQLDSIVSALGAAYDVNIRPAV